MSTINTLSFESPYLIFTGEIDSLMFAKTGSGIVQWSRDKVAGQYRFEGNHLDLGVPDMSIEEAKEVGVKTILIGVAPVGGEISKAWIDDLIKAASLGIDIVSGLHVKLESFPGLKNIADKSGSRLINVRTPPANLPIGNGIKRSGKRVLMVGTDCSVGKKYTALALAKELKSRGVDADFRATGQTGIMISGKGIPIDAVVSDFVSGAAELISPSNHSDHWDVIEGQGSLFNPSYAGVSLGLLHGSQPDAIVVCHEAKRTNIGSCPQYKIPSVQECIDLNISCGSLTNPKIQCVGVSINTSQLATSERKSYLEQLSQALELPCFDPIIDGCSGVADKLLKLK